MKKHDEGYALVLVLVVVLVLNIAAMGLMTLTLNNLKTQRNLVDRMVDKYDAQGEIEKVVAQLNQMGTVDKSSETIEIQLGKWIEGQCGETPLNIKLEPDNTYTCTVELTKTKGTAQIRCVLSLSGKILEEKVGEGILQKQVYKITPEAALYASYDYSFQETSPSETTEGGATG